MRAFVGTLFFLGVVRLLFPLAGAILFLAGTLDVFLFDNQASGLLAVLAGFVVLASGYTGELWLDSPVTGPSSSYRLSTTTGPAIRATKDSAARRAQQSRGTEPTGF